MKGLGLGFGGLGLGAYGLGVGVLRFGASDSGVRVKLRS